MREFARMWDGGVSPEAPMTTIHSQHDSTLGPRKAAPVTRIAHVYLDVRRKVLRCLNDAARQLVAEGVPFTSSDLAKRPLKTLEGDLVVSAQLPLLRARRERAAAEDVFVLSDGEDRVWHLTWHAAPLFDAQGEVIGVLGTLHMAPPEPDWAELAGLAHDLRTPLQSLRLLTWMLGKSATPEATESVERLGAAVERALAIGMDILEWCRSPLQAGRPVTRTWFPLTPFAAALIAEQLPTAQKKSIALRTNLTGSQGWEVHSDATRLGRLLANLLTNAVHYTKEGSVELKASWRDDAEGNRQGMTLSVIDTGPGITQEEQESIFEPFRRGRSGKDSDSHGSGVGLAVVERLVEELELKLEVFSQYGRGSEFELVLPMKFLRQALGAPVEQSATGAMGERPA
jgi:nitrogen-specific signal transduction histidine kinase